MARGVNKVILVGNLGADPETRVTPSGTGITNLRIATTESWRDKQSGERQEKTEWHTVVLFGRLSEIAGQYLKKGRQVYIEGRLQTRKWQDKDGHDRYSTEVVANDMQMLGSGGGGGGDFVSTEGDHGSPDEGSGYGGGRGSRGGRGAPQPGAGGSRSDQDAPSSGSGPRDDFDDDIPF